ncbi:hypothetical protein HJB82_23910 [Rhizobium sp. NZLR10]|uniref:TniQ family protein n=1 Tax=Rhizobium sp. NZLR10 TaxID=2731097 RepID=UPI001C8352D7|nr:TniQ family protein [Rhizobium sp. NZLR10]MBX5198329.1 hypothetical protein [Rhizobium sp. NZLR10]
MTLPVVIKMHEEETPVSRANRLSSANGFASFRRFLEMTSIRLPGLSAGNEECIAKLAKWSGVDPVLLAKYASRTLSRQGTWRIGEATFGKESRRGSRFRYCPLCVVEDVDADNGRQVSRPYVRPAWMCRAVLTCSDHRRPIVEFPFAGRQENDFCQFVASNLDRIRAQASEPCGDISTEMDDYIATRIRGVSAEPYLDRFEAFVAIDLCDHLGRFFKTHALGGPFVPDEIRGASPREIGFHLARKGEQAIRDAVASVVLKKRPNGTEKFLFGTLGRWLRSNAARKEFTELVELFQDIAECNQPYGPGEVCFVPVRRRRLHSVITAEAEYGLYHKRVIELLKEANLIEDATIARGRIFFDAEKAQPILLAATLTLTSQEARAELGVTEFVLVQLLNSGLIPRVEGRTDSRVYSRIRRVDVRELQQNVFQHVTVQESGDDTLSLATVCRVTVRDTSEILRTVINGGLRKVTIAPHQDRRIDNLRFDRLETFEYFLQPAQTIGDVEGSKVLKQRDAAEYLSVKATTVPYLMKLGLLDTIEVANPVNRRKQLVVTRASLDNFKREYVAVFEIALQYDTHTNVILEAFRVAGIEPIYDKCGSSVSRFFRRRDIDDVFLTLPKRRKRIRKRAAPRPA